MPAYNLNIKTLDGATYNFKKTSETARKALDQATIGAGSFIIDEDDNTQAINKKFIIFIQVKEITEED